MQLPARLGEPHDTATHAQSYPIGAHPVSPVGGKTPQ
jgi:hypothetical protein